MKKAQTLIRFAYILSAGLLLPVTCAWTQTVYVGIGHAAPDYGTGGTPFSHDGIHHFGYAHRLSEALAMRVERTLDGGIGLLTVVASSRDWSMNTSIQEDSTEFRQTKVVADWHPWQGRSFRFSFGLSHNQVSSRSWWSYRPDATQNTLALNGKTFTVNHGDSLVIRHKMPTVTPYVGFGASSRNSRGFFAYAELGWHIGRALMSEERTGNLVDGGTSGMTSADVLTHVKSSPYGKRFQTQFMYGLGYRF